MTFDFTQLLTSTFTATVLGLVVNYMIQKAKQKTDDASFITKSSLEMYNLKKKELDECNEKLSKCKQ